ncbi:hypothetical protein RB595_005566 [Gaeumannomyces hyphopodioides]
MDITFGVPVPDDDEDGRSSPPPRGDENVPELIVRTPRLAIRAFRNSDAAALQRQANDADVSRTLSDHFPFPYTAADAEQFMKIALPENGEYALFRSSGPGGDGDDVFVGGIKLRRLPDVYSCGSEVGYWIGREFWGQGLATEAVVAFSRWAFESHPDMERLESLVYATNMASSRVLEKAGFTHEGTRRRAARKRGEIIDVLVYGLLRDENGEITEAAAR